MKIIVALDSFKGSVSSKELNDVVEKRLLKELDNPEIVTIPISDGGEGFLESYSNKSNYETISITAHSSLMNKVKTSYLLNKTNKTAIIESAEIIGLDKVEKLLPLEATSYGLGEVMMDAVDRGAEEVIVGLGGSATNDAGIGMLVALGFKFYDEYNQEIDISLSNLDEARASTLDNDKLNEVTFKSVTDVKNIFTGNNGASKIFGPQKGLKENQIDYVDQKFKNFNKFLKKELDIDLDNIQGAGAAGGISGSMKAFLNADILPGIKFILESVDFETHCKNTDLIITGEGKIDNQSFYGKVIQGISDEAEQYSIPVIALGGSVDIKTFENNNKIYPSVFSIINTPIALKDAMRKDVTIQNLDFTVKNLCNLIKLNSN